MVTGREQWLERDGRAVQLYPRRFGKLGSFGLCQFHSKSVLSGQENPPVIAKLSAACPGQVCGVLAGAASHLFWPLSLNVLSKTTLTLSSFDAATQANMIALAIEYRQAEKNTPPDFTTNPPTPRNSVFCQKAPKNSELNGLVQAQDPANDPTIFFDPATKATVRLGDQPNTFPFGQASGAAPAPPPAATAAAPEAPAPKLPLLLRPLPQRPLPLPLPLLEPLVTLSFNHDSAQNPDIIMQFVCDTLVNSCGADQTARTTCATARDAANAAQPAKTGIVADTFNAGFGISTNFAAVQALDNQANFNHGSAQNIDIITRFVCDQLVNFCGADQTAQATCATAITAASGAEPAKTGIQADAFNAVFGITTNFASVQAIDDQGRPFGPTGNTAPATTAPAQAPAQLHLPRQPLLRSTTPTFTAALGGVKAPTSLP
ncbi:Iron-sulfur clusters transporter atm [Salix suchowensis]|nr:Iron-sulfur clusters transporter atm [Salix suchowensis]